MFKVDDIVRLFASVLDKISIRPVSQSAIKVSSSVVAEFAVLVPDCNHRQTLLMVQCVEGILVEAIYKCLKANGFGKMLINHRVHEVLVRKLMELWSSKFVKVNSQLVEQSYSVAAQRLTDVNWKLKVVSSQSRAAGTKEPLVQLDLKTGLSTHQSLECNHSDLSSLYKELENIQNEIDCIDEAK